MKQELEAIYEQTVAARTDYLLLEDVQNFDWDYFWKMYILTEQNIQSLTESFELIQRDEASDRYSVTAGGGPTFELWVNFINKDNISERVQGSLVANMRDRTVLSHLQDVINATQEPILNVNFKDSEDNIHQTGNAGNYAFTIVRSIRRAIVASLFQRTQGSPDVLYFYILKTESKKLEFFKNVYGLLFPKLKNQYTDSSDSKYNLVYFFA